VYNIAVALGCRQMYGRMAAYIYGIDIFTVRDKTLDRTRMGSGYRLLQ
jgi:hypothetical protein